jgi:hypothetical protein
MPWSICKDRLDDTPQKQKDLNFLLIPGERLLISSAREYVHWLVKPQKRGTGIKNLRVMDSTLWGMRKRLLRHPTLTAKQLKALLPAVENIPIRTIWSRADQTNLTTRIPSSRSEEFRDIRAYF